MQVFELARYPNTMKFDVLETSEPISTTSQSRGSLAGYAGVNHYALASMAAIHFNSVDMRGPIQI